MVRFAVNQCNGVYNGGGQAVECHVVIQNRLNLATGVSSSTSTVEACRGVAGAALTCTVQVTNAITGSGTQAPVTTDQCIGSGGGGGTEPTTVCSPIASTTNADITQCNGSANNGVARCACGAR